MAFGTFSVRSNLPQNRLQLSFTLLLTSIAFKMVINQSLPKISYLTYMDKYVLMSLVFLVLICVWHSLVPNIPYADSHEIYVLLGFFLLYILGHFLFAAFVYVHVILSFYHSFCYLKKNHFIGMEKANSNVSKRSRISGKFNKFFLISKFKKKTILNGFFTL